MIKLLSLVTVCLISMLNISFSNQIKINGSIYNGEKLNVYQNVENIFVVEFSNGGMGSANCDNSNFTVTSQDQAASVSSTGTSTSNGKKLLVKINVNPNTTNGTTAKVDIDPLLSTGSNRELFSFGIICKSNPSITSFELVDNKINTIKTGEAFKIRIKGTNLEDLDINLPKQVTGKIIRNKGNEVIVELVAGKNLKSLTIDDRFFDSKQSNVKLSNKAKSLIIKIS